MAGSRKRRSEKHQTAQYPSTAGENQDYLYEFEPFEQFEGFVQAPNIQDAGDFMSLPDSGFEEEVIDRGDSDRIQSGFPHSKHSGSGLYSFILIVCSLALIVMGGFIFWFYQPKAAFEARKAHLSQDIIFEGVKIDGVDVGAMNRYQAMQVLHQADAALQSNLQLRVEVDGAVYMITQQQLPFGRNTVEVIHAAYAIGRQGYPWMVGSDKTPFDIRYEHTRYIRDVGAQFETQAAFSQEAVYHVAMQLAEKVNQDPQNAQLASFDFDTRSFSISREITGTKFDIEAAATSILQTLKTGQEQGSITLQTEKILPQITAVELQNSLSLLSSFTTKTSGDELRNTNIALAARAIHGTALLPGESFSFNRVVGQRTAKRGYQLAPAIAGGVLFDDIGGGICQVSSTLFNAAALANMSIQTREPHAWPVSYVEKGLDATVNWPNIDFVFKNDTKSPVFIVSSYKNRQLSIELYGIRKEERESIRLETAVISTSQPPASPKYQQNTNLLPGEERELKKARNGFVVETYRVFLRDGQAYKRDKLFSSVYPMVQQVIEYNGAGG